MNNITEKARKDMSMCGKVHGPNWAKWLGHLIGKESHGFEVGTFRGDSAEWMCSNIIITHPKSTYDCMDIFNPQGSAEHVAAGIDCSDNEAFARERLKKFEPQVRVHKLDSKRALKHMWIDHYHFCYIDGDHHGHAVLYDEVLSFELLKVGGVMIFDDFGWNVLPYPDRPKEAIEAFINLYRKKITVLSMGYQVAIRKDES